jgi:hypothetical protein
MQDLCDSKVKATFIRDCNYMMQKLLGFKSHNFVFNMAQSH